MIKKTLASDKSFTASFGEFSLEVFGSAANSLWTKDSDIDIEISLPDHIEANPCDILSEIENALGSLGAETEKIFGS